MAIAKAKGAVQTSIVAALLALPLAIGIGYVSGPIALGMAQTGAVSGYAQLLHGTILSTNVTPYYCSRDGDCVHTYDCDSYQVETQAAYTDTNKVYHPAQYTTEYHHCPVATMEYSYTITAQAWHTFTWTIVDHGFDANPRHWCCAFETDGDSSMPSDVYRGVPAQWLKAKYDLAHGNSDPVHVPDRYQNYILANESTILRANSGDIAKLRQDHLLPTPPFTPIHDFYLTNEADFIGLNLPDSVQASWQDTLSHFNAAFGTNFEGDMHVVAYNENALNGIISPDALTNALQADWLNDYGKDAMAKNALLLVVGVNPTTNAISWARAVTGMPIGNETMEQAIELKLQGVTFDPSTVFGNTTASVTQDKTGAYHVNYVVGNGIVSQITTKLYPFLRACMNCKSARDKKVDSGQQGFVYLKTELPLPTWGVVVTILVDIVILFLVWGFVLYIDSVIRESRSLPNPYRSTTHTRSM
jgi:hypothetical protein